MQVSEGSWDKQWLLYKHSQCSFFWLPVPRALLAPSTLVIGTAPKIQKKDSKKQWKEPLTLLVGYSSLFSLNIWGARTIWPLTLRCVRSMGRVTTLYNFTNTDTDPERAQKWEGKTTKSKTPGLPGWKPPQSLPMKDSCSWRIFKEVCFPHFCLSFSLGAGNEGPCLLLTQHVC